jgi:hypothetical protein
MNKRIPYLIILLMLMAEETGVVVAENNTTKPHAIKASIYQRPISGVPIQPTDNTGTCNSEAGCTALEKACQKLKGISKNSAISA